jgi:hypothetical protein
MKVFYLSMGLAIECALLGAGLPASAWPQVEPCAGTVAYHQPKSIPSYQVFTYGKQTPVDALLYFTDSSDNRWVYTKIFNGRPGMRDSSWQFGWIGVASLCKS